MKTIGFTEQYYTLWNVSEPYRHYSPGADDYVIAVDYTYIQNLSKDLETARAKMRKLANGAQYAEDFNLRGESNWTQKGDKTYTDWTKVEPTVITFGKFQGTAIAEAGPKQAWHLMQMYKNDTYKSTPARFRVNARKRLIELGELFKRRGKYTRWENVGTSGHFHENVEYFGNYYVTKKQKEYEEEQAAISQLETGHHFTAGEKVELEVTMLKEFGFESEWGYTTIQLFATADGKLVKYMGGSPKEIPLDTPIRIATTVKHSEYRGEQETKLLRIKLI